MKQKLRQLFAAALAAVMALCFPPAAAAAPTEIGSQIEAFVVEHADTTAGMAVSVFQKDSVLYHNYFGYANREAGLPVDENTVMEWGSVTKLLVWVSVMQLTEQGKLDLNADVQNYLPEGFLGNLTFGQPITMLHLMNHTAGFEDSIIGMMTGDECQIMPLETYLRTIQPRQVFAPGTVTAYSNWGAALAGYIVERISGLPFYEYVRQHIFNPLGMTRSALNADLSDNPWVRRQREKLECYTTAGALIPDCQYAIVMYPAGMCTSTLGDLETFAMALLDRESPLFADPATYDAFLSPTAYFPDTQIPLNHHGMWSEAYYSVPVIGHGGNTMGCSAKLLLDVAGGVGMVVMTNQYVETTYTNQMPSLVFGQCSYAPLDYTGLAIAARTVYRGPMKLYRLLSITALTPEASAGALSVLSESGGMTKITVPSGGGDYLVTTVPELMELALPLLLWALALLFCLVSLMGTCIHSILRKLRRRPRRIPPERWATAACVLQPLSLLPMIPVVTTLLSGDQWPIWQYRAVFASFLVFAAVFAGLAVYGIVKMCRRKRWTSFCSAVIISLLISIFNIFYWELGCFWMI